MLALWSMASATDSGKSPAVKAWIACGRPSSKTSKSPGPNPVTGAPERSLTVAYTSTRLTEEANCGAARAPAPVSTMAASSIVSSSEARDEGERPADWR